MNENGELRNANAAAPQRAAFRPKFAIYHPNARGTGCAIKMELHPATGVEDGCIMLTLANQKTIASRVGGAPVFPTFDWEKRITVKLDFSDLCKMLQVFRGECESIDGEHGLYHTSAEYSTKIVLRHVLEPAGYSLEVYRSARNGVDEDVHSHIFLNNWEALGIALSFENSIGIVCFGVPKAPAAGEIAAREPGDARAA